MSADPASGSLRERKQRRTRDAIVRAAYELFAERGFDEVTVAEIADRAEVGRTTFFRYFGDKQEVLFRDEAEAVAAVADHVRETGRAHAPIGESLPVAIELLHGAVAAFATGLSDDPERIAVQQRLLARHPELHARYLLKQQRQAPLLAQALIDCGAAREVAVLAVHVSTACLHAAGQLASGRDLRPAIDDAFARLLSAGAAPRAR